ncbi:branched-chain amino acid ABC transporter permease [Mangrovactinospora gilvigrisea]|uniref:Branched-chain amino acid ABC transporter permease n=1 Tax=Mangrovactinospora gilvigrisea TaxID=1428644 RepID=A0A1J7B9T0_9ACTN|nr:branched-chain amino acid ABC transporter permease [Mangrovactinospora gilvigrisea]OIV35411.1 branched-chain amino acid ABC transporter permease [Mangrovactinospora gilvigrisea]
MSGGTASEESFRRPKVDVARLRRDAWYRRPRWRRLLGFVVAGLALAVVTGPQGAGSTALMSSLKATFTSVPRLGVCVGIGVLLWAVREFGAPLRAPARTAQDGVARGVAPLRRFYAAGVWPKLAVGALVLLAGAVIPNLLSPTWQVVFVEQMGVYLLLAVGLNVVIGWAGLLDLGFVAFYAVGAYSVAFWTGSLPVQPPVVLNPFVVIPIAVLTCLAAGLLLGTPTLRLRGDYLAIVTLGFHEIVYLVAKNADGFTGGSRGTTKMIPHPSIHLFGLDYNWMFDPLPYWYLILAFTAILVVLFSRLENSRIGRAWTAVREDEVAAQASGLNTVRYKLMAFAIGASTSGLAGVVYASKVGFINPDNFPLLASILVLSYVIFGGMGSIAGVLVGTALLTLLPQWLKSYVPAEDRYMYLGGLLVAMMIFRPQGVIPSRRRQREIKLAESGVGGADATGAAGGTTS